MNKDKTDEFSFILKPAQYGVGVFATHDIKAGTSLRLFGDETDISIMARGAETAFYFPVRRFFEYNTSFDLAYIIHKIGYFVHRSI